MKLFRSVIVVFGIICLSMSVVGCFFSSPMQEGMEGRWAKTMEGRWAGTIDGGGRMTMEIVSLTDSTASIKFLANFGSFSVEPKRPIVYYFLSNNLVFTKDVTRFDLTYYPDSISGTVQLTSGSNKMAIRLTRL